VDIVAGYNVACNRSADNLYTRCRSIPARHFSTKRGERLAETITGVGGQGFDGETRQGGATAFGRIGANALVEVERCLAVFLGIAK
jgi:hypothetical protein